MTATPVPKRLQHPQSPGGLRQTVCVSVEPLTAQVWENQQLTVGFGALLRVPEHFRCRQGLPKPAVV